jgi:hypothetical protein
MRDNSRLPAELPTRRRHRRIVWYAARTQRGTSGDQTREERNMLYHSIDHGREDPSRRRSSFCHHF